LAAALAILPLGASLAVTQQEIEQAHARVRADKDLQFEFSAVDIPEPPGWLAALIEAIGAFLKVAAPLIRVLFWAGVFLIAAFIIYILAQEIAARARHRRAPAPDADAPYQPSRQFAKTLLEEADRLAAEGRFAEAVHVLLFRSIEDIDAHRPNAVRKSMTSREIGALSILPAGARAAFAAIAATVERVAFAGRTIGAPEFQDCRAAYRRFAAIEDWA
jgi:hypothetical protein